MTQLEQERIFEDAVKALENGNEEQYNLLLSELPVDPDYVMSLKDIFGGEIVRTSGINLSAVEKIFGPDWYK